MVFKRQNSYRFIKSALFESITFTKVGATILLSHEADAIGMKNLADKFSAMANLEFMYHHGVVIWWS